MKKKIDFNKVLPVIIILVVLGLLFFSMADNFKNTGEEIDISKEDKMADDSTNTKVKLETNHGDIVIELYSDMPITAGNFENLVKSKTYDGVIFHRIIPNFMIQGGDPTGTGRGDPNIPKIQDEFTHEGGNKNNRATISMANAGPNTGSSQFFINLVNNNFLDGKHPTFGEVVEGMDVVDKIAAVQTAAGDRPVEEVKIIKATIV
jgi:peptidylprolyl isomerase